MSSTNPSDVYFPCPECGLRLQAAPGVATTCPKCGAKAKAPAAPPAPRPRARPTPPPPAPHMPLPPDRDDRPRPKRLVPGRARSFCAILLLIAGVWFLHSGWKMDTTAYVPGQTDRVHNTGLLNERLVRVVIGVGLLVFSGLMKAVAVLEVLVHHLHRPTGDR
ncbi:hypothetical protein J0H58_26050 [bacterium]|mgnify:CR=1 FL=1|nr:hypothetical protein [bacterium]